MGLVSRGAFMAISVLASLAVIGRSHAATSTMGTCGVSNLGYQCWLQVCPSIAMHWSLGGPAPAGCRYPQGSGNATDASASVVHFALVTDLDGYVAMSLPVQPGIMAPADAVIALAQLDPPQGGAFFGVHPYFLSDYTAPQDVDTAVSLDATQVSYDGAAGLLTACFSRPTAALGGAGVHLDLASPALPMNFAASPSSTSFKSGLHIHAMDKAHLCGAVVSLVAASQPGGENAFAGARDPRTAVVAHGILMIFAWLVLLPTGVLMARHRWMFPVPPPSTPSSGPSGGISQAKPKLALWFVLHRFFQLSGLAFFSVGFLLPWVAFGEGHGGSESSAMKAHSTIGIIIAVLAYSQLTLVFIRPKPDAPRRVYWNLQHWWTGRTAVALAIVQILIGIQVFHEAFDDSKAPWISVVVLLLVVLSLAIGALEVRSGFWSCGGRGAWEQLPLQEPQIGGGGGSGRDPEYGGKGGGGGGGSSPPPLSTLSSHHQVMQTRSHGTDDLAPLLGAAHHRAGGGGGNVNSGLD